MKPVETPAKVVKSKRNKTKGIDISKPAKQNKWVDHVKSVSKIGRMKFGDAMRAARESYLNSKKHVS